MGQTQYTIAVLGATGLVGQMLIDILAERQFPVKTLKPLASERSIGQTVTFNGQALPVELACPEAFNGVDIVLASAGGSVSAQLAPEAVKRGAVVIDNTSHFRLQPTVPLVVAGVNDEAIKMHPGIIANPNCSTAQLMPVLKALHQQAGLNNVVISTYQSVSGAGKEGMDTLQQTTMGVQTSYVPFQRPIAFNLIPHIDVFIDDPTNELYGYTKEEAKLVWETRKILDLPQLPVTATAVRVPVMVGHSEAVTIGFERPISPEEAKIVLSKTPDVVVSDGLTDYPTPLETAGTDPVYVGRIRRDNTNPERGLHLWVVADNLRIGAALNAVRLAELLVKYDRVSVPQQAIAF